MEEQKTELVCLTALFSETQQTQPTLPKFDPASKTSHSSSKGHAPLLSRMLWTHPFFWPCPNSYACNWHICLQHKNQWRPCWQISTRVTSLKAVLKLDPNVRTAWIYAIKMEIKNLIDHKTFILGEQSRKEELIIPVKLVLKAKQTATGSLDKLKARLDVVAGGDMEKRRIKKTKAAIQQENTTTTPRYCQEQTHILSS